MYATKKARQVLTPVRALSILILPMWSQHFFTNQYGAIMTFDISKANVQWVSPCRQRANSNMSASNLVITAAKAGKGKNGEPRYNNTMIIPCAVMKASRVMHGDRVNIGLATIEGKGWIVVSRTTNDSEGYKVSKPTENSRNGYVKFGGSSRTEELDFPERIICPNDTMQLTPNGFAMEIKK